MSPGEIPREVGWLLDMLLAARKVREFTAGATWDSFRDDEVLQNAVMHQIQVIGEAARCVSEEFRAAHSRIPWQQIVGMRNKLVHHYFAIIPERVWAVVERDLAALITQLEAIIPPDTASPATSAAP